MVKHQSTPKESNRSYAKQNENHLQIYTLKKMISPENGIVGDFAPRKQRT